MSQTHLVENKGAQFRAVETIQPEDCELVKRAQIGETVAFKTLVERHQRAIYNLCYRMLKGAEDAKDATQETFFKAYRALKEFRHESRFQTWLYRIATHECLNRLRDPNSLSLNEMQEDDEEIQIADSAPSPLELIERKEVQSMIHQAIDALPHPYRLAITLYHLNELSYEEIAQAMNVPIGTVKTYLFRARAALKSKLKRFVEEG
jgi:RNA polymerase sigma-70 factor (ECF subfamily)